MNSFMAWVGGKKALREEIVARFPLGYKRYIEVFGGAGWVLFHKPPGNDFEVFNDFNGNLVNLYRCVREHPKELKDELRYSNDEAKLIGMEGNRHVGGSVYAGPMIIIGDNGDGNCCSLTDEQIEKYSEQFRQPEEISQDEVQGNMGYTFYTL